VTLGLAEIYFDRALVHCYCTP